MSNASNVATTKALSRRHTRIKRSAVATMRNKSSPVNAMPVIFGDPFPVICDGRIAKKDPSTTDGASTFMAEISYKNSTESDATARRVSAWLKQRVPCAHMSMQKPEQNAFVHQFQNPCWIYPTQASNQLHASRRCHRAYTVSHPRGQCQRQESGLMVTV